MDCAVDRSTLTRSEASFPFNLFPERSHQPSAISPQPSKAMIVVQRSTLNQFYYTFQEMYPQARVFCAAPDDFSIDVRQRTLAKIAYYDWDCVILTHDSFGSIAVKAQTEVECKQDEFNKINREISRFHSLGETTSSINNILKQLEKDRFETYWEIKELQKAQDVGLAWEDLGVDLLIVDEIQRYKNNYVESSLSRKIAGLAIKPSGRAKDFDLKVAWLRKRFTSKALIGMSGTPEPTNSMLGVYVFQSYFQPEELEKRGLSTLDAWIANFGEIKARPEPKIDGKWRITERLTDFINVGELAQMWFSACHFKRYDQVKHDFKLEDRRPEAIYETVVSYMSAYQKQQMEVISDRYEKLRAGKPELFPQLDADGYLLDKSKKRIKHPQTKEPIKNLAVAIALDLKPQFATDNFLLLYGDSRKLILAPQLIDPKLEVDPSSKMTGLAIRVLEIYQECNELKGTQVVFLDLGTPGGSAKFGIYEWLRDYWIKQGVPRHEIEFIQSHKKPQEKELLFQRLNEGSVRILISSSEAGGIGVNIQKRLYAIHHGQFALRPDILEQREGRGIRQGNLYSQVKIIRYITEGSNGRHGADTVLLQFLENKQKMRDRFFRCDPGLRRISEDDNALQLYMMLKAESTGDERIMRYTKVEVELEEKEAELALAQSELGRVLGNKSGSIENCRKIIEVYLNDSQEYENDINKIIPFVNLDKELETISFCYEDGLLVVGHKDIKLKKPYLVKPAWLSQLRSLYSHHNSLLLLPLKQARKYISTRLISGITSTNVGSAEDIHLNKSQICDWGAYKGLQAKSIALGDQSFQFWLEGDAKWRVIFRSSSLLEQMDSAIATCKESKVNNEKKLAAQEARFQQLLERRDSLTIKVKQLKCEVIKLTKKKVELEKILNLDIS